MDDIPSNNKIKSKTCIRTGSQYLEGLKDSREIWMHGKRVKDVTKEDGLKRCAESLASFIDKQHNPKFIDDITYVDSDGDRCGLAFKIPKSKQDIKDKGKSYYEWAKWSNGYFGRTPDYKNASVMAFAAGSKFLEKGTKGQGGKMMAQNMINYYNYVRKNDKVLTHTLVNPTYNHQQGYKGKFSEKVALQVVKATDAGVIVNYPD